VTDQIRTMSYGSIVSVAVDLVMGLPAFHRGRPAGARSESAWMPTILKGAGLISPVWLAPQS